MEELLCELFGGLDFGFFRVLQSAKFFSRHDEFCRPYGTPICHTGYPALPVLGSIIPLFGAASVGNHLLGRSASLRARLRREEGIRLLSVPSIYEAS